MDTKEAIIQAAIMIGTIAGIIIGLIVTIYLIGETWTKISNFFIYYRSFRDNPFIKEESVAMSIKDLKKLYKVNPSKWEVDESYGFKTLHYTIPIERIKRIDEPEFYWHDNDWTHQARKTKEVVTHNTKKIYIYFNLPQYIWFLFNNRFRKSLQARSMESENLRQILTDCQNDIDAIKAAADTQLQSALGTMKDVDIRLKNEGKENG